MSHERSPPVLNKGGEGTKKAASPPVLNREERKDGGPQSPPVLNRGKESGREAEVLWASPPRGSGEEQPPTRVNHSASKRPRGAAEERETAAE